MLKLVSNFIKINRLTISNQKFIATQCFKCNQHNDIQSSDFIPVYKFPQIRIVSLFNHMKWYQTLITVGGIPLTYALSLNNVIDNDMFTITSIIGITGCIALYTAGFVTNKFVGIIYINKNGNQSKISYLDFWGRRKDVIVDLNDIVPMCDMSAAFTDPIYLRLQRYSVKDTLKISFRFGKIVDQNGFNKVFLKDV